MVATNGGSTGKRPSDERRERMKKEVEVAAVCVSNFFPIERYYEIAEKLFQELVPLTALIENEPEAALTLDDLKNEENLVYCETFNAGLDFVFLYAKRYCTLCVEAIPTHDYYNAAKNQALKQKHLSRVTIVITLLERVAEQMDVQEQILLLLLARKDREDQRLLLQRHQNLNQQNQNGITSSSSTTTTTTLSVQESAMEKLKLLSSATTIPDSTTSSSSSSSSTRYRFTDDSDTDTADESRIPNHAVSLDGMTPLLPPTMVPPLAVPTPPSYEAVVSAMQNRHRPTNDTSYIRPPPFPPGNERPEQPLSKPERERKPVVPMRQLQEYYKERYMKYQQMGKIRISPIDTYQGRLSASTNGCTVISALIAARHLQDTQRYSMISSADTKNVIDVQCGPILRTIRKKLGLGGHALIIPSDVHDHLVDENILLQEQFTGVAGGNIMNKDHYMEFLQLLSSDDTDDASTTTSSSPPKKKLSNGKAGATLFFREHVISIVKSIDPNSEQPYYDLIDSMPAMLQNGKTTATRTRCTDIESLEVLLLWYASRKFSDANCTYIDRNPWSDNTADLDPRVFQGFVWSS